MKQDFISRRDFLKNIGIVGASAVLAASPCNGLEKTRSPFEINGVLSQVFSLGVMAQRLNTQLFFDSRTKQITNNEFANSMLAGIPPRKGWEEFYKL